PPMVAGGAEVSLKASPSDARGLSPELSLLVLAQALARVRANHLEESKPLRSVLPRAHKEALRDQRVEHLARGAASIPGGCLVETLPEGGHLAKNPLLLIRQAVIAASECLAKRAVPRRDAELVLACREEREAVVEPPEDRFRREGS